MTALDLVLQAPRVVTTAGEVAATIGVAAGRVVAVGDFDTELDAAQRTRLDDDVVLIPGLVDTHVHVNEPGRTEWEGFASATRAAAAGGVTTIVDMPLNSIPPTTDVTALEVKRRTARGQVHVDVGFWGGAVPRNLGRLRALHEAGVLGFKCFLAPSGVAEFGHLGVEQLEVLLGEAAALDALVVVHAEDAEVLARAESRPPGDPRRRSYADFVATRPAEAENRAVAAVVEAAGRTGCRVHVLHLASADALATLAAARADGVRVTAETCPHYLALTAEEVPDGATQYKCCPPIRDACNAERLWRGLREGLLDCVVSDHSPCTADLKCLDAGDFQSAWGGISSLQVGLPVVWTQARRRGIGLVDVVRWMAENPARQAGLRRKGRIAAGFDADFCVFAPDDEVVVRASGLHHKNPVCVYEGRRLTGAVRATWLAGRPVDVDGAPRGRLLGRGTP